MKIVIDAYNGTVDFYLMDSADPIAATYQRIFPGVFKPFAAMPPDLQQHIRYPEDLSFPKMSSGVIRDWATKCRRLASDRKDEQIHWRFLI